jgi:uncharacterized membrane protein SpoIIM required for sporulation
MSTGSQRFRAEREADWRELERLLDLAEGKSLRKLSDDELVALPGLYRATTSALSVARETSLDANLIAYLEGLTARGYFFIYGVRSDIGNGFRRFFVHDWPAAVRAITRETLVALALLVLGAAIGYLLVLRDPAWYAAFVPDALAAGRDPQATTAALQKTLYTGERNGLSIMAAFLFTHNAQVAILAFALGFAFGIPTVLLLLFTGCMAGAFFALFASHGLGFELGGWMMIHGTTELFAVVLAGAAGLAIGRTVAFPGMRRRSEALAATGKSGAQIMIGVAIMLFVAGLLEGFARQLITNDLVRYAVATTMLACWLAYFYLPRGRRSSGAAQ